MSAAMDARRFALVPEVAPDVAISVDDDRGSLSPDDDVIEVGFRAERHNGVGFAVMLGLAEITRLSDALSEIIETPLP